MTTPPPPERDWIAEAPSWRAHPYRLFFPLAIALLWAGLLHWVLWAVGSYAGFRILFHAVTQTQGFMLAFVVGFLFTALPRRTKTAPPSSVEMLVGLGAPAVISALAWLQLFAAAQVAFLVLGVVLLRFAIPRLQRKRAGRPAPDCFVWIPMALGMGGLGAVGMLLDLTAESWLASIGLSDARLYRLGSLLVQQGMFLGFIVGVGGMVLPLLTVGDAPPDSQRGHRGARLLHVAAALLLTLGFVHQAWLPLSAQTGEATSFLESLEFSFLFRAALLLVLLLFVGRIYRKPAKPGRHRWLIWASAWAIPLGYVAAALLGSRYQAGLHIVFVAGFGMMAMCVALHVSLAHGGRPELVGRPNWQVPVFGVLMLLATIARMLRQLRPTEPQTWLGLASAAMLLASVVWLSLWLASLRKPDEES